MKLLILTQKVNKDDPILGFFHRWIEEFSKHCEKITVLCLEKGEYNLPANVCVLSLGKESGVSRLKYFKRFYFYIWRERNSYDSVFVHMNQEYIFLGWFLWRIWRKKIALWRNHHRGNLFTRVAMVLSDHIFYTSQYSFTAKSKKATLMPVGIDINLFKKENSIEKKDNSILFLARISPVKRPHLVIRALRRLRDRGINFNADFYGNPSPRDISHMDFLKDEITTLKLNSYVSFQGSVSNRKTPQVYNVHEIFINASPSGMYDKTIFEAMACETLILTSNRNLIGKIDERLLFIEDNEENLAEQLEHLLTLSSEEKQKIGQKLRSFAVSKHSLTVLGEKLMQCLAD